MKAMDRRTAYIGVLTTVAGGLLLMGLRWLVEIVRPPPLPPLVALSCTTSGLPDLAVVCQLRLSQSTALGTRIDFGDGRSVDLGGQVRDDQDAQDSDTSPPTSIYHKYSEPGPYRINVLVRGDRGTQAQAHQDVRVSYSDELDREIQLTALEVIAYGNDERSAPLKVPVNYRLGVHNLIFYEQKTYTVRFTPSPGWVIRKCDDLEVTDKYFFLWGNLKYTQTEGTYRFELQSSPFFSGSEDGYLYANIPCIEYPEEVVKRAEIESVLPIKRYGVIEATLGNTNPMVAYSTHEGDWKAKFSRGSNTPTDARWSEPIKYRGVRLTLIDPPLIPADVRRNRVYLRIEPDD